MNLANPIPPFQSRRSKGGWVNLLLEISPKCGQGGGGGQKSRKFCGRHLWMVAKWDAEEAQI